MASNQKGLTETYRKLLRLYKNPTRPLNGVAASNQDAELMRARGRLLKLFTDFEWDDAAGKPALYFKILSLLYEVDDYFGTPTPLEELLRAEASTLMWAFGQTKAPSASDATPNAAFTKPETRSLWKAKIRCCLAAIESRRRGSPANVLLDDLSLLETFIRKNLHRPQEGMPAWTTLALVQAAQAKVARQNQNYFLAREKLLSVVSCLDHRAEEIIEKLLSIRRRKSPAKRERDEVEKLTDDLVFIRQKQTLSILFNVGLADLQRGSLSGAAYACQAARLQFRLHGQFLYRWFNELVLTSIKRAITPMSDGDGFLVLKKDLEERILPPLKPGVNTGNPRLYLYGLKEMAIIQYYCGEITQMSNTLEEMESVQPKGHQWLSRIDLLYSHAFRRQWELSAEESTDVTLLNSAVSYSEAAFKHATGLGKDIGSYKTPKALRSDIETSMNVSVVDTLEALIAYGRAHLRMGNSSEAIKSAAVVIEFCKDTNPKLLAMGHLVAAEAHAQTGYFVEAHRHLTSGRNLEGLIDHKYVADIRIAVEKKMPDTLDLSGCKDFSEAEDRLMGWYIEHKSEQGSVNEVSKYTGINRTAIKSFLKRLESDKYRNFPYRHLTVIKDRYAKRGRKKKR